MNSAPAADVVGAFYSLTFVTISLKRSAGATRHLAITHHHYRGEDSLWRTAKLHHKK